MKYNPDILEGKTVGIKNDSNVIVGANQTERYIPLLKGKRVGIVANLSLIHI